MTNKKVYVVRGSEDGNLGVYGNVKAAYEVAANYIKSSWNNPEVETSYSQILKVLKERVAATVYSKTTEVTVRIELFYLNN